MTTAGLHVHRAERADALAAALGGLLAAAPPDPFVTEIVAVPAKGVERWLAQRLSHRLGVGSQGADGVCAGVAFPSPGAVVAGVVGAATGVDPADDPWASARLVWPLLEVLDASAGHAWAAPLATHLGLRRHATARRLAELFVGYAVHRPELLRGWRAGLTPEGDLGWQAQLWRLVRERIDSPGPSERLVTACTALRDQPERAGLPPRLSLFGPTRLPAEHLAVLAALAQHREVHLWLPHPSPVLWSAVARVATDDVPRRRNDPTAATARHPLLSSMGRDVRELQVRLSAAAPGAVGHHHAGVEPPPTLLGRLQRELREDAPPAAQVPLAPGDRSVQVHSCHGPDRQVEVLREIVLGLLDADPTLQPRDVLVMCPDIETFAPLVSASFGLGAENGAAHPGHRLPVRLADRALRQVNPLLDTVAQLLELADARLTAAQALDLLASGPVRLRFRLDEDDLDRLRELVVRAGVRWGLDGEHRGTYRLEAFRQNTWAAGLDRLLLGVTTADEGSHLGTALPLAELDSGDTVRIGRLAEFVHRLGEVLGRLRGAHPLTTWISALTDGLDLLTDTTAADGWQAAQARAELADAARSAGPHAAVVPLGLADVCGLLAERLRGRPTRAGFRTGLLTVATLVPMRSVPHRVICLLGLDDGVFPRAGVPDGDDVLARDPLVGERDPRSEDRQLLLDAVCAATEALVVVHSGADERSGARRPPAVPLGELLDAVEATAGRAGREQVHIRHPLQPFDARNFTAGALVPGRAFSFDRAELAGAVAATGPKASPLSFVAVPLEPLDPSVVRLDDLVTFLEHPVKGFLRQRVGLSSWAGDNDPADALPVDLDGLATWAIGDRLLHDRLAGHDLDRCRQAEWRRGDLPPGALGTAALMHVLDDVEPLVAASRALVGDRPHDLDVDVELPDGTRVVGTLGGLHNAAAGPGRLVRIEYSRIRPKQRIRAWARLLALTAQTGDGWQAVTLGRGERHGLARVTVGPLPVERARDLLVDLVALRRDGLCEPLPVPMLSAHTYARVRRGGGSAEEAIAESRRTWTAGAGAERDDDAHALVWSAADEVLTGPPGSPGGEPTRFGQLAMRVWMPLLDVEQVTRP